MDQNIELLRDVVRSARSGEYAVQFMMDKTDDEPLRQELCRQKQAYEQLEQQAEAQLTQRGEKASPGSMAVRAGMWMGLEMDTLTDRSVSHFADLLVQGNTMGLIDMTRARKASTDAEPAVTQLADQFIGMCHDSIERSKPFL